MSEDDVEFREMINDCDSLIKECEEKDVSLEAHDEELSSRTKSYPEKTGGAPKLDTHGWEQLTRFDSN